MLKLTSRQKNIIQNEIDGCFYQSENAANPIRHNCDKFEKFGAEAHPCVIVRAKTSALRSALTHTAYRRGHTFTKALYLDCVLVSNVFASLRDVIFLSNDPCRC